MASPDGTRKVYRSGWSKRQIRTSGICYLIVLTIFGSSLARSEDPPPPPSPPALSAGSNPAAPPKANLQASPDREFDLLHIALDVTLDDEHRALLGAVVNVLTPLRDKLDTIGLQCGQNLIVTSCAIDGKESAFRHEGELLSIVASPTLVRGKAVSVRVRYNGRDERSGFHWIRPTAAEPHREGFWTVGVPARNHRWIPTWDYPNDFATSEMSITAPLDWDIISNGVLESNTINAESNTHTVHWKMDEPHATYLNSIVGGPFDIKTSTWHGVELMYVVPKGKGNLIDDSFGDTPDMLDYFSTLLKINYPWKKYAQCAMYDYSSGIENVSATTLDEEELTESREGFRNMAELNSHELAHQWFGDLVTCKDWGHLWLNEGFATFFRHLYTEHSRGKDTYDHSIGDTARKYFTEAQKFKRPLAADRYETPASQFDQHTYSKGALVLHMLRRTLGDEAFFNGLHHYLAKYQYKPVVSRDLLDALSEGTKTDLTSFFDQWVFKPGHPVLDYSWEWDRPKHEVVLKLRQVQNLSDGTPVFDLNATVGMITGGQVSRFKVKVDRVNQQFRIAQSVRPSAVLFDPDHDLLREIPDLHWSVEELPAILRHAPNAEDREEAMHRLLAGSPSETAVQMVADAVFADQGAFPAFRTIDRLGELQREKLRSLFRAQLSHPNSDRRAQAIAALSRLPKDPTDAKTLRKLVDVHQPYLVIRATLSTLAKWDARGNRDIFEAALRDYPQKEQIRVRALGALMKAAREEGRAVVDPDPSLTRKLSSVLSAIAHDVDSPLMTKGLKNTFDPTEDEDDLMIIKHLAGTICFIDSIRPLPADLDHTDASATQFRYYTSDTAQGPCFLRFSLTADGKVADVDAESDY
jgi:aminopeptidase N